MIWASPLVCFSVPIPVDMEEVVLELLEGDGFYPTTHFDALTERSVLRVYAEEKATAKEVREALARVGEILGLPLEAEETVVPTENWTESWKRFFHVTRVSERVVIRPVWEAYEAKGGEVVVDMEPGMSFGTGCHGTTQACLQFLDALAKEDCGRSVLDMGCGSGILAIAARKLGFAAVRGVDNDPDAVRIAQENAVQNGEGEVVFAVDDVATTEERADVVVANILAPVLIEHAAHIAGCVKEEKGAALLVSGILEEQYGAVRAAFEAQGFRERESRQIEIWRSGWLVR